MNRCIKHPFDYCTGDVEFTEATEEVTYRRLGGLKVTEDYTSLTCPNDWRTCSHRRTQSQLYTAHEHNHNQRQTPLGSIA